MSIYDSVSNKTKRAIGFSTHSVKGFTLIELLVTIAIIAIISVVAVALFGNLQADARDGKRRAELESLANALEVNKTGGGGNYNPLLRTQLGGGSFPGGTTTPNTVEALDPQSYPYCINASTTITPPTALTDAQASTWTTAQCPTTPAGWTKISGTQPVATTVSWTLCTRLENKGTVKVFCRSNTQ